MAYKIRYGPDSRSRGQTGMGIRWIAALAMTMGTLGVRLIWPEGSEKLAWLLARTPASVGERAVAAMGQALAEGMGWYHGLVVWCRSIIEAGLA